MADRAAADDLGDASAPSTLMKLVGPDWRRVGSSPLAAVHGALHGNCPCAGADMVAVRAHDDGGGGGHIDFLLADGTVDCPAARCAPVAAAAKRWDAPGTGWGAPRPARLGRGASDESASDATWSPRRGDADGLFDLDSEPGSPRAPPGP